MSKHIQPYLFYVATALAASSVACGGSASITEPDTPVVTLPAARGVTIQGSVQSGAAASELSASSLSGIRVSVVGTALQVTTDGSGRFTLTGVPEGRVELRFEAPGLDARLTLDGLVAGQTLTLIVRVSGNSVSRVDDDDDDDEEDEVEFKGTVDSVSPGDNSLMVSGRKVIVRPGSTRILDRNNLPIDLARLAPGDFVEVEGVPQSDGSILADKIKLEDEDDDEDEDEQEVEFEGSVSALSPLTIAGRAVTTNSSTRYLGRRNEPVPASDVLKAGNRVEVEGRLQTDGGVLAEKIKLED